MSFMSRLQVAKGSIDSKAEKDQLAVHRERSMERLDTTATMDAPWGRLITNYVFNVGFSLPKTELSLGRLFENRSRFPILKARTESNCF